MNHHPGAIQEECMAKMEMNRQEEYLNRIDRLKLMDDDFFSEALDGKMVDRENVEKKGGSD